MQSMYIQYYLNNNKTFQILAITYMNLEKKRYSERIIFSLFLIFQLLHENEVLQILKAEFPIPQTFFFFLILYPNCSEAHFLSTEHMQ